MSILDEIKVNRTPTHMVRAPSLTLSRDARQAAGKYVERQKLPGEAGSPSTSVYKAKPYRTGDGDTSQVMRPGSMDAYSLPSKGFEK